MSKVVARRLESAARHLGTVSPLDYVGPLLERTFPLPAGDVRYARNTLMPGAAPLEPSFSELEPYDLRFNIQPLGPQESPVSRRDEATREMRRLVGPVFGDAALRWFDERSEEWRGMGPGSQLHYGAFFGTSYDRDGMSCSKVYYETTPGQTDALPSMLSSLVRLAMESMPSLFPLFTSITCRREQGSQRSTFVHRGPLRLADLQPLLQRLGMAHQLPGLMQVFGLALGGRFELPEQSVLLSLGETVEGPEFELYVLLGMLPDLPPNFLGLLNLGLAERPRELQALSQWLEAFTPEEANRPGRFSVLSVRVTPRTPAKVSLYLRPIEFEVGEQFREAIGAQQELATV
jgi:hypothetical protein